MKITIEVDQAGTTKTNETPSGAVTNTSAETSGGAASGTEQDSSTSSQSSGTNPVSGTGDQAGGTPPSWLVEAIEAASTQTPEAASQEKGESGGSPTLE